MSNPIYTFAVLRAKEGRLEDLKSALETLAQETRQETGVIEYLFVQDENHDPNTILSYEKWQSSEEEAKHWQTPHLKQAITTLKDLLDGDPIIHRGYPII